MPCVLAAFIIIVVVVIMSSQLGNGVAESEPRTVRLLSPSWTPLPSLLSLTFVWAQLPGVKERVSGYGHLNFGSP